MFIDDQNGWTEILTRVKFKVARHLRNIILFEMKHYSQIKVLRSTYLLRDCCGISIIHVLATTGRGGWGGTSSAVFNVSKETLGNVFCTVIDWASSTTIRISCIPVTFPNLFSRKTVY